MEISTSRNSPEWCRSLFECTQTSPSGNFHLQKSPKMVSSIVRIHSESMDIFTCRNPIGRCRALLQSIQTAPNGNFHLQKPHRVVSRTVRFHSDSGQWKFPTTETSQNDVVHYWKPSPISEMKVFKAKILSEYHRAFAIHLTIKDYWCHYTIRSG